MRFKVLSIGLVVCILLSTMLVVACGRRGTISPQQPSAPQTQVTSEDKLGLHTTEAKGEKKYIVVLSDFPNVKRQYPEKTMADRLIGSTTTYFRAASYSNLILKGDITRPYVLPNPVSYYKISPRNLEVDLKRVVSLV